MTGTYPDGVVLDDEEQEIEDAFNEYIPAPDGMPYQTLLGSVIHKYVTGALVDVNEVRKVLTIRD